MKKITMLVMIGILVINSLGFKTVESSTDTIPYFMFNAATVFRIDIALLYALCDVESKCKARAINKDDARKEEKLKGKKEHSLGLFQIKLATARCLGFKGTYKELMKPEINTYYAAKLLRHLYDRYGNTYKVISAYNAGRYVKSNSKYVDKVFRKYIHYKIDLGL